MVQKESSALSRVAKDPVSRRKFIALGGGSAAAAFLVACGSDDSSTTTTAAGASGGDAVVEEKFGKGDVGILNYTLTLEYLEPAFYADVVKSGLFKGSDLATIRKFGSEEAEHVTALTAFVKKLGGKPAAKPKTEFPLKSARSVLELAGTVENLGAAAYLGQAAYVKSPEVLSAALSIHSVEGRHAAALNTLLGESITPDGALPCPRAPRSAQVRRTLHRQLTRREKRKENEMSEMTNHELAQPELAGVQIEDDSGDLSRGEVILKGALAAGAVYGAMSVAPFVSRALAMSEGGDVGILRGRTRRSADRNDQEAGRQAAKPKFDFPYGNTREFLQLAQTFEDTGVSAYNGAAPQIKSKEVLAAAGSIVQVEARHAAAIRPQNKQEPSPEAFDPSLNEALVLKAVEPFIQ